MNIGLVDVDGHNFPNLALMKLCAWHKSKGHTVGWADMFGHYDVVYKSKVFTWTPDDPFCYDADEIQCGGTGYGDYKKVVLLDNNIVASRHGIRQLEYCRDNGIAVDCNQGMDARIICKSEHLSNLIADLKPYGTKGIRIACDMDEEIEPCHKTIQKVLERNPKALFVVYCILTDNYEDSVRRVLEWRKYGHSVAVYAPPYRDFNNPRQVIPRWQKDLSRWASNHFIYYGCEWEEYRRSKGYET